MGITRIKHYTIEEIAEICNTKVDEIRIYEQREILKPNYTDQETNQKFYTEEQIFLVDCINELRNMNFTFDEIKNVFISGDFQTIQDFYNFQVTQIDLKIKHLETLKKRFKNRINSFKSVSQNKKIQKQSKQSGKIKITQFPARTYVYVNDEIIVTAQTFIDMHNRMQKIVMDNEIHTTPPCIAIFHGDYLKAAKEKSSVDVCRAAFLTQAQKDESFIKTLPEGKYAAVLFNGAMEESIKVYNKLVGFIKDKGYVVKGPLIKLYHVNSLHTQNEEELVSEFQIKVERVK